MVQAPIRRRGRTLRRAPTPAGLRTRRTALPVRVHLTLPTESVKLAKELGVNIQAIARKHYQKSKGIVRGGRLSKIELEEMIYSAAGPKRVAARDRKKEAKRRRDARLGVAVTAVKAALGSPF